MQIVDAAVAEAVRRSGAWVVCRPGCTECCIGPFDISADDAERLRRGLADLEATDPARAVRIRDRARAYTGGDDEPCPALDPSTGACDLYAHRPITCRAFGPAIRSGDAVAACELCYRGATEAEIAACAVDLDLPDDGESTVARCLAS